MGELGEGDRLIAQKFIERIARVVKEGLHKEAFVEFLNGLQKNLNPSIDEGQAVEMLAQHMITRPVFDALFKDYQLSRIMRSAVVCNVCWSYWRARPWKRIRRY